MFGRARSLYKSARTNIPVMLAIMIPLFGFLSTTAGTAGAQDTRKFDLGSVVATTADTVLLDQPSASGVKVMDLPVNAQGLVQGGPFNDGWYWLDFGGTDGYADGKYLVLVDANYQPVPEATATSAPPPPATSTPRALNTPVAPPATSTPSTPFAPSTPGTSSTPSTPSGTSIPSIGNGVTIPTTPGDYTGLWLAELSTAGNVRVGPGFDQKILKGWWVGRRVLLYQAVPDGKGAAWYRVSEPPEQPMWIHSTLVRPVAPVIFQGAKFKGRWVNVDLTQQIVTAYQDGTPVMVTLASTGTVSAKIDPQTGKPDDHRTNVGVWKIYYRLPSQEMKGGSKVTGDYYDLKDVPWVQYFYNSGEALHGTYWHDDFGHPHSHGCVNLSTPISQWFYGWANIGTVVWVHY